MRARAAYEYEQALSSFTQSRDESVDSSAAEQDLRSDEGLDSSHAQPIGRILGGQQKRSAQA